MYFYIHVLPNPNLMPNKEKFGVVDGFAFISFGLSYIFLLDKCE